MMTIIVLPFILIWIGVVIKMPIYYYALVGFVTIFDVCTAFLVRGDEDGNDTSEK